MGQQMFFLDYLEYDEPDVIDRFKGMTIEQVVEKITEETGFKFKPTKDDPKRYYSRNKDFEIWVELDAYIFDDYAPFISLDWKSRKDHSGGGTPCDSLDEVIRLIKSFKRSE